MIMFLSFMIVILADLAQIESLKEVQIDVLWMVMVHPTEVIMKTILILHE